MKFSSTPVYIVFLFLLISCYVTSLAQDSIPSGQLPNDSLDNIICIENISISGNTKTKDHIIFRELSFKPGDCISKSDLKKAIDQSIIDLLKMPLFNYVTIEYTMSESQGADIQIIIEERWYLWPQLAIINNERNFNNWWKEKDLTKLDFRFSVKKYNVLGLNHVLRVGVSTGFTQEFSAAYQNISIDRKQKHLIGLGGSTFQYKSVFFNTLSNKQESFKSENNIVFSGTSFRLEYTYRPAINSVHKIITGFQDLNASDTLISLNPNYLAGNEMNNAFLEIYYQFIFDKRNSRSYPLSGKQFVFTMAKFGIGIPENSPVNLFHFRLSYRQFYQIAERFFGAHSVSIKKSWEDFQPYYYRRGLGYYDFIRGFEYYVIEGEDYYLFKNVFKYELLPKKISYLDFIPIKKFKKIHYAIYFNLFFDMGYAHEKDYAFNMLNNLSNKLLYSGGIGTDLVTYYDKVIRLEYSLNSLGESGFYIHFVAPI